MSNLLILCFRADRQYAQLGLNQLAKPTGFLGDQFPYNKKYLRLAGALPEEGVICVRMANGKLYALRRIKRTKLDAGKDTQFVNFEFRVGGVVVSDDGQPNGLVEMSGPLPDSSTSDPPLVFLLQGTPPAGLAAAESAEGPSDAARWIRWVQGYRATAMTSPDNAPLPWALRVVEVMPDRGEQSGTEDCLHVGESCSVTIQTSVPTPRRGEIRRQLTCRINFPDEDLRLSRSSFSITPGLHFHRFRVNPIRAVSHTFVEFVVSQEGSSDETISLDMKVLSSDAEVVQELHGSMRLMALTDRCKKVLADSRFVAVRDGRLLDDACQLYRVCAPDPDGPEAPHHWKLDKIHAKQAKFVGGEGALSLSGGGALLQPSQIGSQVERVAIEDIRGELRATLPLTMDPKPGVSPKLNLRIAGMEEGHTAFFGQTGSGKSYSLGVLVEEMLRRGCKVLALDPNSDFANFGKQHSDLKGAKVAEYEKWLKADSRAEVADFVQVLTNEQANVHQSPIDQARCVIPFHSLGLEQLAALLEVRRSDDSMYSALRGAYEGLTVNSPSELSARLSSMRSPAALDLQMRLENYELNSLPWAVGDVKSTHEHIKALFNADANLPGKESKRGDDQCCARRKLLVVDLGKLGAVRARQLVATEVLRQLKQVAENRANKDDKVFVVIDEAHNLVSSVPETELQRVSTEYVNWIAAEGRKYGLCLVLVSQRPSKLHPNALGMMSNLVCMRVTNLEDLRVVRQTFGDVPKDLIAEVPTFKEKGEAVLSGTLVNFPCRVRLGYRLTAEGA